MAEHNTVEVGNATIVLVDDNDPLSEGPTTGYLEFYDDRHRPAFPLTSHTVSAQLQVILHEPSMPSLWKAGRITGWMEALLENASQTFRSMLLEEGMTVLQEAYKEDICRRGNGSSCTRFP